MELTRLVWTAPTLGLSHIFTLYLEVHCEPVYIWLIFRSEFGDFARKSVAWGQWRAGYSKLLPAPGSWLLAPGSWLLATLNSFLLLFKPQALEQGSHPIWNN